MFLGSFTDDYGINRFVAVFGIYSRASMPRKTQLQLETIQGLYRYGSSPADGSPRVPFVDTSKRMSQAEEFYETE